MEQDIKNVFKERKINKDMTESIFIAKKSKTRIPLLKSLQQMIETPEDMWAFLLQLASLLCTFKQGLNANPKEPCF
jgi:hypothetical protein